jgi:protein-S-isoprenylcysteine O-methyltransferase Ste14
MRISVPKLAINIFVMIAVFVVVLFLPAGTLNWLAGWIFLVLMFAFTIVISIWLMKFNPDLLAERLTGIGKAGQKKWDKYFLVVLAFAFFGWFVLMSLDAMRFRWSQVPNWLQYIGVLALLVSFYIFYLTFKENTYLSPAVRVQTDRGQTVISTGPYRYVRHPMYGGFVLFAIGTALLLGSVYGILGAALLVGMVAWRAVREEEMLEAELKGYREYKQRVRYRFVPHVW